MSDKTKILLFKALKRTKVDEERHVIMGASAMQSNVEALGHGFLIDDKTLTQLVALGNGKSKDAGIKSRFTHPSLSSDGLGKFLGRGRNFRHVGDKVLFDLHLSDLASKSPDGDLRDYAETLARDEPDIAGFSVVVSQDKPAWKLEDGTEVHTRERPDNATTDMPFLRLKDFHAVDLVDEPAANRDGVFSAFAGTTNALGQLAFAKVDDVLLSMGVLPADIPNFVESIISGAVGMPADLQQFIKANSIEPEKVRLFASNYVQARRVRPARLADNQNGGINLMTDQQDKPVQAKPAQTNDLAQTQQALNDMRQAMAIEVLNAKLNASGLPLLARDKIRANAGNFATVDDMDEAIKREKAYLAELNANNVINIGGSAPRGGALISGMVTSLDQMKDAIFWLFGAHDDPRYLPPPELRNFANIYRLMTGDWDFHGVYRPDRVSLATASTTTLPNITVDAMNKVILRTFEAMARYRWYESITRVEPNDGTVHNMKWQVFGGINELPVVDEGQAYTELDTSDTGEQNPFVKRGGYVGLTMEAIRNSDLQLIRAIPEELARTAIRTRSQQVANIFLLNPILAQDGLPLFDPSHGNLTPTPFSFAGWKEARTDMANQTIQGTTTPPKRLMVFPRYALLPNELYDDGLQTFGWGAGATTIPASPADSGVNPYAADRPEDPRPIPLAMPELTDSNDWYAIADPREHPVIHISYSQNQGGRIHVPPELFSVVSETSGLMFTNDVMPIKVRDWYSLGVSTYRGILARIVP